jgi:hypothetical protein
MNLCVILYGYRDKVVSVYECNSLVNGNKDREIIYC